MGKKGEFFFVGNGLALCYAFIQTLSNLPSTLRIVVVTVLLGSSDPVRVLAVAGNPLEGAQVQVLPQAQVDVPRQDAEVAVGFASLVTGGLTGKTGLRKGR